MPNHRPEAEGLAGKPCGPRRAWPPSRWLPGCSPPRRWPPTPREVAPRTESARRRSRRSRWSPATSSRSPPARTGAGGHPRAAAGRDHSPGRDQPGRRPHVRRADRSVGSARGEPARPRPLRRQRPTGRRVRRRLARDRCRCMVDYGKGAQRRAAEASSASLTARRAHRHHPAARHRGVPRREEATPGRSGRTSPRARTPPGNPTGLADGAARVDLDGRVKVALEDSVPQIHAPEAWAAGYDGAGATVAVLDTGYDPTHPDLQGRVVASANFTHRRHRHRRQRPRHPRRLDGRRQRCRVRRPAQGRRPGRRA